ncbi:MAG: outer membrane beta-barrel family protein [Bacteroidales bacterium]|nr:outer membrane beta-barrel family protein [Bacteroidales bacterium]
MKRFIFIASMAITALASNAGNYQSDPDSIALDSILSIVELKEIVVKGQLPNTRLKGNAMVTKVSGSVLEKAGTAQDVLRKVPGMIKKGDYLEVIGRGTPIYYINGRRVRDTDELKRLMSDEVANVEVITNPGAMYDASVSAVVRITTVRRQGDGFGFSTFAKTEQSLRTGMNDPEAQVNINYRTGGWDFFVSAKEWEYRTNQWSDLGQITTSPKSGEELFRYEGSLKHAWRGIGTHLTGGLNWQVNDRHSLGAKVDYAITTDADTRERLNMDKWDRGSHIENVNSEGRKWSENPHNVLVNAYYNGTLGRLNIDFNTDMFFSKDNEHQDMDETATTIDREVRAVATSSNDMVATKLVLSYPLWRGQLQAGTEETFVSRKNSNEITGTPLPDSRSQVKDNVYAGFVQYNFALSQDTYFNFGVRYEHAFFDYVEELNPSANLSRSYDNVFPSASFSTKLGKVRASFSYASYTSRPQFWQLSNAMSYHNRYVFQQGNATLKPSTQHNVGLTTMWGMFTIGANYSYTKDLVCNWSEQYNDEGTVRITFRNIDKPQHQLNLFAVASHTWGCYSPTWTAAMVKQWLTLDFDNGSRSFGKPMWVCNLNNAFRLPHRWQLELNSEFHSKAHYSNVELVNNYWSLETAVQKSFLKNDALTLRLAWQDMLRKGNNDVYIYYGSYSIHQTNTMDFNRVILTLRYNFNTARSKYKGTGAGKDARNRIGSAAK